MSNTITQRRFSCKQDLQHADYFPLDEVVLVPVALSDKWTLCSCSCMLSLSTSVDLLSVVCSLLCRTFDSSLAEACHEEGVRLLAYSPLAMGLLTVQNLIQLTLKKNRLCC